MMQWVSLPKLTYWQRPASTLAASLCSILGSVNLEYRIWDEWVNEWQESQAVTFHSVCLLWAALHWIKFRLILLSEINEHLPTPSPSSPFGNGRQDEEHPDVNAKDQDDLEDEFAQDRLAQVEGTVDNHGAELYEKHDQECFGHLVLGQRGGDVCCCRVFLKVEAHGVAVKGLPTIRAKPKAGLGPHLSKCGTHRQIGIYHLCVRIALRSECTVNVTGRARQD